MPGPLQGIRVLDLCHAAVGPWAAMLLASLGADVLKLESPGGDLIRLVPPQQRGLGVVYSHCNLGKRAIILDLKTPAHQAVARKLAERADVIMENMRPGTVDRLGLGYEAVRAINPRIIYGSASAWGATGPMGSLGGVDPSVQAFCGWTSITGAPGGQGESFRHFAHLDLTTSSYFAASVMQMLLERERTGQGGRVELTMLGTAMNLQLSRMAEFFATGRTPAPLGSACATTVPHQAFQCEDRRWLAVGVVEEAQWAGFCRALFLDTLIDDPRFATNRARVEHRAELVPLLEAAFARRPSTWWAIRLTKARVPNGLFLGLPEIRHHAHVVENGYLLEMDIPHQGQMLVSGLPWQFGKTPPVLGPSPFPGQHTGEVLRELEAGGTGWTQSGAETSGVGGTRA